MSEAQLEPLDGTVYRAGALSSTDAETLAAHVMPDTQRLAEQRWHVLGRRAYSWSYSRASIADNLSGTGGGTGTFAIWERSGEQRFRIELTSTHGINVEEPIDSNLAYEGIAVDGQVLALLADFERNDGLAVTHVVLLTISPRTSPSVAVGADD